MDISCQYLPYIIAAYALGGGILTAVTYWALRADRKARQQLAQWRPDVP